MLRIGVSAGCEPVLSTVQYAAAQINVARCAFRAMLFVLVLAYHITVHYLS